jgi:uncharacterized protein with LGFP repeats
MASLSPRPLDPILPTPSPLTAGQAIGAKYTSLGGSSGFLGPAVTPLVSDPGNGAHIDYKGGSIYWSLASGAHVIYGDIYKKWIAAGGVTSVLGYPTTDEASTPDNKCRFNNFSGGAIYWTSAGGAYMIYGDIYKKWISVGGEAGVLGYPTTDEASTPDNKCRFNNFSNGGAIYWTSANGAYLIYGEIYKKWISVGGEAGILGYPTTDEASTPDNKCRFNDFSNGGAIYWTSANGAHLIYGEIYKKWISLSGEAGALGYPLTDETSSGTHGGRYNDFLGGTIYWSPATGAHDHEGNLPPSLSFKQNYTFPDGIAASGNVQITVFSNGNVQFQGAFHDSGALAYNYSVACVLVDADQQAYSLAHTGNIAGTFESGSRDDVWNDNTTNGLIQENWRALVASTSFSSTAQVRADVGFLIDKLLAGVGAVAGVIALF